MGRAIAIATLRAFGYIFVEYTRYRYSYKIEDRSSAQETDTRPKISYIDRQTVNALASKETETEIIKTSTRQSL